jgi:hypothetical protein
MGWVDHVARIGDRRGVYRLFVGKPEAKGPFWRCRLNEDNIKLIFYSGMERHGLD